MSATHVPAAEDAAFDAFAGLTFDDPLLYAAPDARRIDAKYFLKPVQDELLRLIELDLEGLAALPVRNESGGTLAAGALVCVTGRDGASERWLIEGADASDPDRPAQFVLDADLNDASNGVAYAHRTVGGLDTSAAAPNDPVYLDTSAGGFTFVAPSSPDRVQVVGRVAEADASGSIWFSVGGLNAGAGGGSAGSGTAGALAKWASSSELGDSIVSDDGSAATVAGDLIVDGGGLEIGAGDATLSAGDVRLEAGALRLHAGSFVGAENGAADTAGADLPLYAGAGGVHASAHPRGGDIVAKPGAAGAGGTGRDGRFAVEAPGGGSAQLRALHTGTDARLETSAGDLIVEPAGGQLIVRQAGGVAGTDDVQVFHDGTDGYVTSESGDLRLSVPNGNLKLRVRTSQVVCYVPLVPDGANTRILGGSSNEWLALYVGEDASSGFFAGLDQNIRGYYDESGADVFKWTGGSGAADFGDMEWETTHTLGGSAGDGFASALRLDPGYTAGSAYTVTRHNYLDLQNPSTGGSAALTDACVMRFDAAAGTHKALAGSSTKATPGAVDAWLKVNINGTVHYVPAYGSVTS